MTSAPFGICVTEELRPGEELRCTCPLSCWAFQLPDWLPTSLPQIEFKPFKQGAFLFIETHNNVDFWEGIPGSLINRIPKSARLPMEPRCVRILDDAARDALIHCICVLNHLKTNHTDALYRRFFKNYQCREAVTLIFQKAHDFFVRFLKRENREDGSIELMLIRVVSSTPYTGSIAWVDSGKGILVLEPSFFDVCFERWQPWYSFCYTGEPEIELMWNLLFHRIDLSPPRGQILLHEIIHFVSTQHWAEVKSMIKNPRMLKFFQDEPKLKGVIDIKQSTFHQPGSTLDESIKTQFEALPSVHGGGAKKSCDEGAYGLHCTELLAKMKYGALATFLNSDNYAYFASYVTVEALERAMKIAFPLSPAYIARRDAAEQLRQRIESVYLSSRCRRHGRSDEAGTSSSSSLTEGEIEAIAQEVAESIRIDRAKRRRLE